MSTLQEDLHRVKLRFQNDARHLFPWAYNQNSESELKPKLEDGEVLATDKNGNTVIGKTYTGAPELLGGIKSAPEAIASTGKIIRTIKSSGPAPTNDPAALQAYRRVKAILKQKELQAILLSEAKKLTGNGGMTKYTSLADDIAKDAKYEAQGFDNTHAYDTDEAWFWGYKNAPDEIDKVGSSMPKLKLSYADYVRGKLNP